jgi:hypothetical protein
MSHPAPFRAPLLSAVTAGTSPPIDCSQYPNLALWCTGTGTISGGTVLIEEADYNPTTNLPAVSTWSLVPGGMISAVDVTGGATQAYSFPVGAYAYVRARISATITGGGTITVVLRGVA